MRSVAAIVNIVKGDLNLKVGVEELIVERNDEGLFIS